jgi:HEAT repeat protein
MRSLITLAALTFAAVASAAEPTMDAVLDSIDVVPTAAQLESVWPDARDRLIAVANDTNDTQWHRVRAASMLIQFPSEQSKAALFALASDEDVEVRRAAVHTAARTFGADGGPELVSLVQGMLEDPDADVRKHAVRSLRWVDDPAAETSLRSITSDELRAIALHTLDRRAVRLAE